MDAVELDLSSMIRDLLGTGEGAYKDGYLSLPSLPCLTCSSGSSSAQLISDESFVVDPFATLTDRPLID